MFPGLMTAMSGDKYVVLSESQNDVDIHALLGSPSVPMRIKIVVTSGVIVGGTGAMVGASTGGIPVSMTWGNLPEGSYVELLNLGRIQGKGGDGGDGDETGSGFSGGGGGGGVGTVSGSGGLAASNGTGTNGSDGGSELGTAGAAGVNGTGGISSGNISNAGDLGNTAIWTGSIETVIYNASGEIWAGGSGGFGADAGGSGPTAGGEPDEILTAYGPFGVEAIVGSNVTFMSGASSPNFIEQTNPV